MNKTFGRYLVLNLGLFALLMLTIFSITGAFLGAQKAGQFFNSPPLAVFWSLLTLLLAAGFIFWKSLWQRPSLLLCHVGCIVVLLGAMWGSPTTHRLRDAAGMEPTPLKGVMMLRQGQSSRQVVLDNQAGEFTLPFAVRMVETGVSYYDTPSIAIYDTQGRFLGSIPAAAGDSYQLSESSGIDVQITRRFENLRLLRKEEGFEGIEGEPGQTNPGYEVTFTRPDGSTFRQYVFERFGPHFVPNMQFVSRFITGGMPKEYRSLLSIEQDGRVLTQKTIRVNDPLYCGGYHFYQSTFGRDDIGPYSGIMVVSDSGVWAVFAGFALIVLGLIGRFWVQPILRRQRPKEAA
jgi:hypothetical protein